MPFPFVLEDFFKVLKKRRLKFLKGWEVEFDPNGPVIIWTMDRNDPLMAPEDKRFIMVTSTMYEPLDGPCKVDNVVKFSIGYGHYCDSGYYHLRIPFPPAYSYDYTFLADRYLTLLEPILPFARLTCLPNVECGQSGDTFINPSSLNLVTEPSGRHT